MSTLFLLLALLSVLLQGKVDLKREMKIINLDDDEPTVRMVHIYATPAQVKRINPPAPELREQINAWRRNLEHYDSIREKLLA
jgi:hypothetical protein